MSLLVDFVMEPGMPIGRPNSGLVAPVAVLAQGPRATTLEKWYRDLLNVSSLVARKAHAFPQDVGDILVYLQVRLDEPCRRTVLTAAVETIRFLEGTGGGVRPQDTFASDPMVKNFVLGDGARKNGFFGHPP